MTLHPRVKLNTEGMFNLMLIFLAPKEWKGQVTQFGVIRRFLHTTFRLKRG